MTKRIARLNYGRFTEESLRERAWVMHQGGASYREIGQLLGCSQQTVSNLVRDYVPRERIRSVTEGAAERRGCEGCASGGRLAMSGMEYSDADESVYRQWADDTADWFYGRGAYAPKVVCEVVGADGE